LLSVIFLSSLQRLYILPDIFVFVNSY